MNTQEHLNRIKAKCQELLEIAEKRTAGKWTTGKGSKTVRESSKPGPYSFIARTHIPGGFCPRNETEKDANAAFIASCAGAAEAGWRATIAAIEILPALDRIESSRLADEIIAAWPQELL